MHRLEPMAPSLYSPHAQCRSRTFRCDHVYRALGVCQFFYGMSIFQTPNIPDSLVQFNFYIGVLALSAEYQQPVCHSRSLSMAVGGGGSSGRYAMCSHCVGL